MSKQSLQDFRARLANDEGLRRELTEQASRAGNGELLPVEALVAFAKARGFDFSPEELRAENDELDENELDKVAGGAGYLKIGGIDGESTDDGHKDWINLLSFSSR